ncbi:hypothetical protein HY969_00910 [Candidatus Kaiserbacteria bacterium]|nr:hypothetical protein [Candidatus Kaiserbacteria bacterium]
MSHYFSVSAKGLGTVALALALVSSFASFAEAASCSIWSENATNGSATLRWTSTSDATSAHIDYIGSVNLSGSQYVSGIMSNRTYTMRVYDNSGESHTCQTTVNGSGSYGNTNYNNSYQRPTCSVTFTPNYNSGYQYGTSGTLSWSTWNATSATISPNVGSVGLNGSQVVYPSSNQVYTMTVNGQGGSNTCTTDSYNYTQPNYPYSGELRCQITANPVSIQNGGASALSWTSYGATRAWLSDGIGTVAAQGTLTVRPESSRNYTLTISDASGRTQTCQATVSVAGSHVPLTQIPYTGDFGPLGTSLAWLAVTLAAAAGATVIAARGVRR